MTDIYGTLLDVHTDTLGSPLTADVAAAATALPVVDATTFMEAGGLVRLNGNVYTYTVADPTLNVLTVAGGLVRAAATDDLVEVYPPATVKRAFIDTGIDGDAEGIWALVPQTMVLALADGLRYEGQRETVLVEERTTGELVLKDVKAAASVAASTVIPEGTLDTHQIEVGVTGNLVQDPDFLRDFWQPPMKFSIVGPDTVYTDSNLVRVTGTTETNPGHEATSGASNDWDWWLIGLVPVDPGRAVRIKAQARRDVAAIGGSPPLPVEARVRIVFYKTDRVTAISTPDMFEALVLVDDTTADTWTDLECIAEVPEGYTHFKAGFQATYQVAGTIDFIKPEIQVLWNRMQSTNYVEGATGWNFDTESAQVESLNVLDTIGAETVSAGSLSIGGLDLETEYLLPLPQGMLVYETLSSGDRIGDVSAETIAVQANLGSLKTDHLYRISMQGHLVVQAPVATTESYDLRMRYTLDGTTPTITSAYPHGGICRVNCGAHTSNDFLHHTYIGTAAAADQLRMAITIARLSGTGTGGIYQSDSGRRFIMTVEDVTGAYAAISSTGSLAQKIKASAAPADPDPPTRYTRSWYANWSRSYDSDLGIRTGDDGDKLYQGYISSTHGNTRSLYGFDYAAIQSALSGATVNKVTITFRVQHSWSPSAGITVYLASHNYTTKPSTWSGSNVTQNRFNWGGQREGSTYTHDVTSLGNEFKAGTTRGLGFGPGPSNSSSAYYGYMYGGTTSGSRPKLTITYTK